MVQYDASEDPIAISQLGPSGGEVVQGRTPSSADKGTISYSALIDGSEQVVCRKLNYGQGDVRVTSVPRFLRLSFAELSIG
jgi:hypothetical protein